MIRTTQLQVAHFLLQKNYLAPTAKADHVAQLAAKLVGLPAAQWSMPFLAAHSRLSNFTPADLLAELYHERRLIKAILMRTMDYVVSTADYTTWYAATRRQHSQVFNGEFRLWGLDNDEVTALSAAILAAVGQEPATVQGITNRLPGHLVKTFTRTSRGGREMRISNVALVLRWLAARGELAAGMDFSAGGGEWQVEEPAYAPLNYWYPQLELVAAPAEAEAQARLVRAYLGAYGPASEADISAWTGCSKSETARAVGALASQTTLVLVEGLPGAMLLLKEQEQTLAAAAPSSEPVVNVLPADDNFVSAHRASRARLFNDQKHQRHVFSSSGAARPTILVDGQVVGVWTWSPEAGPATITWQLLVDLDPALRQRIKAEMEQTAAFLGLQTVVERD